MGIEGKRLSVDDVQDSTEISTLDGAQIIAAMRRAMVDIVVAVPDITTSEGLLWPLSRDPAFQLIRICKEDEGISICSSLVYCGRRPVLMMQQTGLLDSLNAVRGIAIQYKRPICMLVGLLGKEPGIPPIRNKRYGVKIIEPVLQAMEVDYVLVEADEEIDKIPSAIDRAYSNSAPLVILLGKGIRP